mgnify:CR=1 FL=1
MSIFNFNYTNGHVFLDVMWKTNYKGLYFANQVITKVGEMSPEQISSEDKNRIIGEATCLRWYYHFKLLTLFEQIVLRTELLTMENIDKTLSSRSESWQVILNDFQNAANILPNTYSSENTGRATKGAALSYLGKAYLHKAGDSSSSEIDDFDNAVTAFMKVVDSGVYG